MQRWTAISASARILIALTAIALAACGGGGNADGASTLASSSGGSGSSAPGSTSSTNPPPAVEQAAQANTPVDSTLVNADNNFGLNVFNQVNQAAAGNVAISPLSIALALQILYNGAAGATQQQMAQALQLQGIDVTTLNNDNAALQASLLDPDPKASVILANSLWMHLSDNPVLPAFVQTNQTYYGAQIGDLAGAPANINSWVSTQTQGLITQILPANFDPNTTLAEIVNALYFKAPWASPFDPSNTSTESFIRADGSTVDCQMMHQSGSFAYLQGSNFQLLRLPYGSSGTLSMLIVLPGSGIDLASFVAGLSQTQLDAWIAQMTASDGAIALPRFQSSWSDSLVGALSALGMGAAFTPAANFSNLSLQPAQITSVQHATVVQVDEGGTLAAAATSLGVGVTVVTTNSFTMTMNRPFFYAIRDDATGLWLFIGTMVDPS